jgi:RNA polymerase sigma factor (sigma-70 family)
MLHENKKLRSGEALQDKSYYREPLSLDKLPSDLLEIVEYKFLHRMTLVEIGKKLGVSRETIRKRLKAAKLLLAEDYGV